LKNSVNIRTPLTPDLCRRLRAGDGVFLSGEIYTGRDAAHRRLFEALRQGSPLPIEIEGVTLFYAAPTPARPGRVIGSIGPTTSYRMDACTPALIERGLRGMIGKGKRSPEVIAAIRKHGAVYFGAIGGIAALTSRCVIRADVAAYEDLGPEAILRLEVDRMPLVVINDAQGGDLYQSLPE
jgi:fumarate hydratase subunit beta